MPKGLQECNYSLWVRQQILVLLASCLADGKAFSQGGSCFDIITKRVLHWNVLPDE